MSETINQTDIEHNMHKAAQDQETLVMQSLSHMIARKDAAKHYFKSNNDSIKEQYLQYVTSCNEEIKKILGL